MRWGFHLRCPKLTPLTQVRQTDYPNSDFLFQIHHSPNSDSLLNSVVLMKHLYSYFV